MRGSVGGDARSVAEDMRKFRGIFEDFSNLGARASLVGKDKAVGDVLGVKVRDRFVDLCGCEHRRGGMREVNVQRIHVRGGSKLREP